MGAIARFLLRCCGETGAWIVGGLLALSVLILLVRTGVALFRVSRHLLFRRDQREELSADYATLIFVGFITLLLSSLFVS